VLRGVAASLVVLHHYALALNAYNPVNSWIIDSGLGQLGACGVDIFFAISGFIMVYTTQGKLGVEDAVVFAKRRVLRIYPLYWVWSIVLLALWAGGLTLKSHHYSPAFLLKSFLLIPGFNGYNYHPFLDQGWTLSFEVLFYVVFACALLLRLKKSRLLFLAGAFAMLSYLSRLLPANSGVRYLLSDPIIIEFVFGVLAAEVFLRLPAIRAARWMRVLPFTLTTIGCVALLWTVKLEVTDRLRFLLYGLPALLIVFGAAMRGPAPRARWLVFLGDASYSIYLTHIFFLMGYGPAVKHLSRLSRLPTDPMIVAAAVVTIALSSFTYVLIERPLTKFVSAKRLAVPHSQALSGMSELSSVCNVSRGS
jgi:exopolysaccharide production protein ExoZ